MSRIRTIALWFSRLIDDVAASATAIGRSFRPSRKVQFVEQPDGAFVVQVQRKRLAARRLGQPLRIVDGRIDGAVKGRMAARIAGSQIDMVLLPHRFMFRPLELPRRASEFLDGIVRAQIDRLTPWSPGEAAFGWSAPSPLSGDRVAITVAATARAMIAPLAQALSDLRANSIVVSTTLLGEGVAPARIAVYELEAGDRRRFEHVRRVLIALLAVAGLAACAAGAAWAVVGADLDAQRLDLNKRLAERRLALLSGRGSVEDEAIAAIEKKKRDAPSSVMVLETLSQALPDDTYLTELRVEEGKLEIAGLTRDAPSLIRLIEQSRHFTRATFSAPTTRAPTENGERFHIEAHVEPFFAGSE